jgi:hypothetical protein
MVVSLVINPVTVEMQLKHMLHLERTPLTSLANAASYWRDNQPKSKLGEVGVWSVQLGQAHALSAW